MLTRWTAAILLVGVVFAVCPGPARAQDCLRVDTNPPASTLTLERGTYLSASAPTAYCSLEPGLSYRLRVSRANHESRAVKLKVHADGRTSFSGDRLSYFIRSLVPGWGQAALGYRGRAFMAVSNATVAGLVSYQAWRDWDDTKRERDVYAELSAAATTQEQSELYAARSQHLDRNADAHREAFIARGALGGWWYLGNLFETVYLAAPPSRRSGEDGVVVLGIPKRSGTRAFFQSFLWPGMGQFYKRNYGRAFFFQAGVMASALFTVDRKLLYDLRDIDYKLSVRALENAQTESERDRLRALAASNWEAREDRRRQFYGWAGVTGGIWLLNVLDVIFSGTKGEFPGRFKLEATYRSGTAYTGFKVAL